MIGEDGEVDWEDNADLPVKFGAPPHQEEWWQCPKRPFLDDPQAFNEVLRTWSAKEKGILPYPGSLYDQPAKLVAAWDIVDSALEESRRMHDIKRKAQKGG